MRFQHINHKIREYKRNNLPNSHQKKARTFFSCLFRDCEKDKSYKDNIRSKEKKNAKENSVLNCCYSKNKNYVDLKAKSMDDCLERNPKSYNWKKFPNYKKCEDLIDEIGAIDKSKVIIPTIDFNSIIAYKNIKESNSNY